MKLVFYSLVLNHHQVCVADALYDVLGEAFAFVETAECFDQKGATNDYSHRPYLLRAWESADSWNKAMQLAQTAECCVFGGYEALPFEKTRMKQGLLSFDMGERMLKRGWMNLASPRILKMILAYHLGGWRNKPIYKLCCSSFAKDDQYKLLSFKDRCYKWGYFTSVPDLGSNAINNSNDLTLNSTLEPSEEIAPVNLSETTNIVRFMWCARFLRLKHPELVIEMAHCLKQKGYDLQLDIYGDEGNASAREEIFPRKELEQMAVDKDVNDIVTFHGSKPNNEILSAMKEHDVFLFTSDSREGWGAVVNESMAHGCAVISSDAIGSTAYLVLEGKTGLVFKNGVADSLIEKAEWLLKHPDELKKMKRQAYQQMRDVWSPKCAAKALLQLIEDLKSGRETSIIEGPCSKA